jgi:phosphoglycerate dehydrogenase-like enzyme
LVYGDKYMDKKYTVLISDHQDQEQLAYWQGFSDEYGVSFITPASDNKSDLINIIGSADALITQKAFIDDEIMSAGKNLRLIQKMGGRADNIDLKAAKKHGIKVATMNLPGSVAVAEHVMMLVLACAKKTVLGHEMTVKGSYRDLGIEPKLTTQKSHGFQWMKIPGLEELNGLTMGIFGFGDIGNEIAIRARAFNMDVIYHKRHPLSAEMEEDLGVKYVSKEDLFKNSDFLVMISPLTPETEKAAGMKELSLMKPTAYFINSCRGGVVDEDALYQILKDHKIAGAGLDVFVYEPIPYDHPFLTLDNVTLSPHIAGGKGGAKERQVRVVLENIQKFANNQPIKNIVA